MIQRKQSLYLLMAVILLIFNLFNPFIKTELVYFDAFKLTYSGADTMLNISTYPLGIYLIIVILLHLFTIFLFKNRRIQMRFTILSLLLALGFYGLLLFYHFMSKGNIPLNFNMYSFGLVSPLLAAIFDFMAYGGIKRDEKLIRDAERLR